MFNPRLNEYVRKSAEPGGGGAGKAYDVLATNRKEGSLSSFIGRSRGLRPSTEKELETVGHDR